MRGVVALLLGSLALLALPAVAGAEGDVAVTICGVSGCATVEGDPGARTALAYPRGESVPPSAAGEYYSLRFVADGRRQDGWRGYYVPAAGLLATIDETGSRTGVPGVATWTRVPAAAAPLLDRATRELQSFPEPELTSAEVGFEPVANPSGYLRLFDGAPRADVMPARSDWQPVVLEAERPSPWTDGTRLAFSPSGKLLRRGQEIVRLPDEVAADLEARAALADAHGRDWWIGALVGAAVALALLAVAVASRGARRAPRRRFPAAT